jgi:hypothetical protein
MRDITINRTGFVGIGFFLILIGGVIWGVSHFGASDNQEQFTKNITIKDAYNPGRDVPYYVIISDDNKEYWTRNTYIYQSAASHVGRKVTIIYTPSEDNCMITEMIMSPPDNTTRCNIHNCGVLVEVTK